MGLDISVAKYFPLGRVVLVCINVLDQKLVVQHTSQIILVGSSYYGILLNLPAYIQVPGKINSVP